MKAKLILTVACLIGATAFAAASGETASASGPKRTFVAACPPVTQEMDRKPGPPRVMVIGAHPDDADIVCGCLAIKLIAKGCKVKFVSVTDGRMGHHRFSPDETARVRRGETLEAARRLGLDGYDIYGAPDCGLIPTYEWRCRIAREIRSYEPDYVITHRSCDYHVDHRATGTLVADAGYLLGVPHWCPEVKAQRARPVILYMSDAFTIPKEIRPDVLVDCDSHLDALCDAWDAQVSQFYDWLPWDKGIVAEVNALGDRKDIAKRNAFLLKHWGVRRVNDAKRFGSVWKERHPGGVVPQRMEVYEVSEYGRAPTEADLKLLAD